MTSPDAGVPGEQRNDEQGRALAMLRAAESVGEDAAVEIGGVRIEQCDEYGKTATTRALEQTRLNVEALRVELQAARDEADEALRTVEYFDSQSRRRKAELAAARRTLAAEREKAHGWEEALHRLLRHIPDLGDRVLAHSMSTQHNVAAGCCMDCHWTAAAVPETRDKETR